MTEVFVKPKSASAYSRVDLENGIPLPVTYSIKDIRQPDKRQAFRSGELKIPGTANNNILFGQIFEVGIDEGASGVVNLFNPNTKADCYVIQDNSCEVLRGNLQLMEVENVKGKIYYSCAIYAGLDDLFTAIKDKLLTGNINPSDDLDFSAFDHTYDSTTQSATWGAVGSDNGYAYPMIDYKGRNWNPNWYVEDFFPAIYVKQYVDKIFAKAGKAYTSSFFTSDFFKHLIIPFNKEKWKFSDAYHIAREFRAERSTNQSISLNSLTGPVTILFNNDSSGTAYDPSNIYDTSTGKWTCAAGKAGTYDIDFSIGVKNNGTFNGVPYRIRLLKNSTEIWSSGFVSLNIGDTHYFGFTEQGLDVQTGDTFEIQVATSFVGFNTTLILTGSYFQNMLEDVLFEGVSVEMNSAIPEGILMSEFLLGLVKMFNLYIEEDRTLPGKYIIEPRDDYYLTTVVDWSKKLDQDQGLRITPMAELEAKRYRFRYTEDNDWWNDYYQKKYTLDGQARTFGDLNLDVNNDWLTGVKDVQPVFAATQMAYYGRVVPEIVKWDGQSIYKQLTASKIRILYYAGLKSSVASWNYISSGGTTQETDYPYAGHTDEGTSAATLDLSFGIPEELQWGVQPVTQGDWYTNNNLFNKYWKNSFDEITDTNAKLATGHFLLTPEDVTNLSFRSLYFIEGEYWRLNQVIGYDLDEYQLTECEFVKALAYGAFVSVKKTPAGPKPPNDGNGNIYNRATTFVQGTGNNIAPDVLGASIIGSDNVIGSGASGIIIQNGDSNIIEGGVSNVTLINTSNQTITASNQLWVNGCQVTGCINQSVETGETPTGTLDGINKDFTLSGAPIETSGVEVIIDGLSQRNGVDFSVTGTTIHFGTAPTGTWIFAYWR